MKIDMHIHSQESLDCELSLTEIIKQGKKRGLDGVAITDHNKITIKKIIRKKGFIFIPGAEIKTNLGEILAYNIKKIPKTNDFFKVIKQLKKQKCIIAIPHPFDSLRKESINNIQILEKIKKEIDFIEINGRSLPLFNNWAENFAKKFGIKIIAGSDAHFGFEIGKCYSIIDKNINVKKIVRKDNYFSLISLILTKIKKSIRHKSNSKSSSNIFF